MKHNTNNIINLLNLLNITEVTDQPIIVHDIDADEDYDITDLIKAASVELTNLLNS